MNDYLGKLQLIDPSKITVLVLDEADVMIRQQGHQDLSMRIYKLDFLLISNQLSKQQHQYGGTKDMLFLQYVSTSSLAFIIFLCTDNMPMIHRICSAIL